MQTKTDRPSHPRGRPEPGEPPGAPKAIALAPVEPAVIQRERAVLHELFQLVADRSAVEPRIDVDFKKLSAAADEDFDTEYQDIIVRFAAEKESVERDFLETRQSITSRY